MSKYQYSSDWITSLEKYERWNLYWYQQKLLDQNLDQTDKIAEIGVGTKFTYNYLKSKNFDITSIDIDSNKNPDIVLNIVDCEIEKLNFDAILAFNIFEHIPYNEFLDTVSKFFQANVNKLFFSIPLNKKVVFEFKLRLGRYFYKDFKISILKNKITAKHHHWELEYKEYTKEKIISDLEKRNFLNENYFTFRDQAYFFFKKKA